MIHLYVVRHAAAGEAKADAQRTLTGKGRRRFRKAARAFGKRGETLDLILTSPLARAVQTAEILAGEARHGEVSVLDELAPGHSADALLKAVAQRAGKAEAVAVVGHDPQLSQLLTMLAHLSPAQASKLELKTGAVVRFDVQDLRDAKAEPRWWLKPRTGERKKGLPFKPPAASAKTAAKGTATAKPVAKPAATPKKKSAPLKKAAPKKARPPKKAAAPVPPKPAPSKPALPAAAMPAAPPRPSPQKFMGTPRPAGPPPAPAAPSPPPPPAGEKPGQP